MNTKYQIFVSSTFDDLEKERSQVIKAVLEMGHIPVGMEMFSAADEEQWKLIARQIDETDYYVVIVGHRYGSLTGGVSYTEKEFDYAISKGVPIYGFIVDGSVPTLPKHIDSDEKKKAGLLKFTNKVKQRPVSFWKSTDELHGKVSIALMKAFNTTPRTGWTRSRATAGPEVTEELSRLSKENAELRQKLELVKSQEASDLQAQREGTLERLKSISRTLAMREKSKSTWDHKKLTDLYTLFEQLGPELIVEKSVNDISTYLAMVHRDKGLALSPTFPLASNHVKSLLTDLHSMGLVEPSRRKHAVSDKADYWSLTSEGAELLKLDRTKKLAGLTGNASNLASAGIKAWK